MSRKKKEKIIWVDDGGTVANLSAAPGSPVTASGSRYTGTLKEKLTALLNAMGFMLLPTLAMVGILAAAFTTVYLLL